MSTDRDVTRVVRTWLRTDEHESADRVLDIVLDLLDTTPQRRSWWPARRISDMNNFARMVVAAAVVVVVVAIGLQLLPRAGGVGGVSPTPAPTPQATRTPAPAAVLPPAGAMAIGRHDLRLNGVSFSLVVPKSGWTGEPSVGFFKDSSAGTFAGGFILWDNAADGIYTDPCARTKGPRAGTSAADLATAIANVPGTTADAPTDVTVGGYPAKLVVVHVPDTAACPADRFYLWWDDVLTGRYASELGSTIRVWIIDVNGTLVEIDGETSKDAAPAVVQEVQEIVDSIVFE